MSFTIYVFAASENSAEAQQLKVELARAGVAVNYTDSTAQKLQQFQQNESDYAILLVSDNLLKSLDLTPKLELLLEDGYKGRVLPIITNGYATTAEGKTEAKSTEISTLNNVMYYRDYWYETWISLRKEAKEKSGDALATIEDLKDTAKRMSVGAISTFIRKINSLSPIQWEKASENEFKSIFDTWSLEKSTPIEVAKSTPATAVINGNDKTVEADIDVLEAPEVVEKAETPVIEEIATPNQEDKLPTEEEVEVAKKTEEEAPVEQEETVPTEETSAAVFDLENFDQLENIDADEILAAYKIEQINDVDVLFHIAEEETEEGDFDNARHAYEQVLTLDPFNGRALIGLARILANHYEDENIAAEGAYKKALICNDDNASLYFEYALLQYNSFDAYFKAAENFKEALSIDNTFEDAYMGLALCQLQLNQPSLALANYLQACILDAERFQNEENDARFKVVRAFQAQDDQAEAGNDNGSYKAS